MPDVRLLVNGARYGGWESVRITRSIETIAGSFAMDVTDRWSGQDEPWAIAEEDACRVEIDGQVVIDGFVDRRTLTLSGDQRAMAVSGRDRAAALVDCSAILDRWTFRNVTVKAIAAAVAAPFGIKVSVQDGLSVPAPARKLVVNPGDSAFQVIERAAQMVGVIVVSDGAGSIVLTRAGSGRAAPLIQGHNIMAAAVEYDATERYRRYVVATQIAGDDNASGGATRIRAEATDEEVRRTDRVLLLRPETGVSVELARRLGDWEARLRAARAETVTITVHGWLQPDGLLWPVNALASVRAPAIGVNGDMLITQATHVLGSSGETTELRLVRPDAFEPEPKAVVKRGTKAKSGGGAWKQLTEGVAKAFDLLDEVL